MYLNFLLITDHKKSTLTPQISTTLSSQKSLCLRMKTFPTKDPVLHQSLPHLGPSALPGRSILSTPLSRILPLHFSCRKRFRPPRWGPAGGVRRESRQIRNRGLIQTLGAGIGRYWDRGEGRVLHQRSRGKVWEVSSGSSFGKGDIETHH